VKAMNERGCHAIPIENICVPGTPDVNFEGGWIELKVLPRWPRNLEKPVPRKSNLRPAQRNWTSERCRASDRVYVLLDVGGELLLFQGQHAIDTFYSAPMEQLTQECSRYFYNGGDRSVNLEHLARHLRDSA
jgi:hypothetical protein